MTAPINVNLTTMAGQDLPAEILAHLPVAEMAAGENLERIRATSMSVIAPLQKQLQETCTPKVPAGTKLIRLRHLASEWTGVFAAKTACAKGCSHCCHINSAVPRSEARLMAKELGLTLSEPKEIYDIERAEEMQHFFGVPCTFLKEGKCSIYKSRPLVCRTLVNMDNTDLLCRLVPGKPIPVPYLNTTEIQGYFAYLTHKDQFADIREWFPNGLNKV